MVTRTNRIQSNSATSYGTGSFASGSFTPSNNSLLYVVAFAVENVAGTLEGTDLTISDSIGLTWTSRAATTSSPAYGYGIRVWTAPVVTGASMTVTVDAGAFDIFAYRIEAYDFTDYNTNVPVGATIVGSDPDGDGPLTITLSAPPAASSIVMAHLATILNSADGTATPGTGWTELFDVSGGSFLIRQTQERTGSTSDSVTWDDVLETGTIFGGATACAVEILNTAVAIPSGFSKSDIPMLSAHGEDNFQAEATNLENWFRNDLKIAA